jgi:hypothetical protein
MKFLLAFILLVSVDLQARSPEWFTDFVKANAGCEREFLCNIGEGDTMANALADARTETAKFFQTRVQSKSQIASSTQSLSASPISQASVDEWTNKTVSEETNELLEGLEIKRQEQIDGHFYVLMVLDREKTASSFKEKIDVLDSENDKAFQLNSRFAIPKVLKNLVLIEALSDRYNLVSHIGLKLKVKNENVLERISKLRPLKMALVTSGLRLPAKLSHTIIAILSKLKIVIVPVKASPAFTLRSELITEEQYFKVDGFKKINVNLRLELINSKAFLMGKISALSEQVARNSAQAVEHAIPEIKDQLQDNLDQLTTVKMED